MPPEPRSVTDIMRDLLSELEEREWVENYERCRRGCCGDWATVCSSCGAREGEYKSELYRTHEPNCKLAALIAETEAYLCIEDQIVEESDRPTSWDHVLEGASA